MTRTQTIVTALTLSIAGSAGWLYLRADTPAPVAMPPAATTNILNQFSQESEALYQKVSASMVRVRVEHSPLATMPEQMQREFDEWRKRQQEGPGPKRDAKTDKPADREPRRVRPFAAERDANATTSTAPAPQRGQGPLRKFLEAKAQNAADQEQSARIKSLISRLDAYRAATSGEIFGTAIDNNGHILVLSGLLRENPKETFKVITADGNETTAKYVGAHPTRGLAILKLDNPALAAALGISSSRPASGELLLCVSASHGGAGWIVTPGHGGNRKNPEERFAVLGGEDHGPAYFYTTTGQLTAIGFDRYALPYDILKRDIDWIVQNGKDIPPRQLGVKYDVVGLDSPLRVSNSLLRYRPAVVVTDVLKDSAAERAGLHKDDLILTLDRRSIGQLLQILPDLATRTGNVDLGVLRDNKEITLELPLDEAK